MMNKLKITNKRNVYLALAMIVISIAGIIHTYIGGGWSSSTGEAAKMFPRLIYGVLIAASAVLLVYELAGKTSFEPAAITVVKWWQPVLMVALTVIFFLAVLYVGTATGIFLYLLVMINLFDEDPKKHWKLNLIVIVGATIVLYIVFMSVLPIITRNQILF